MIQKHLQDIAKTNQPTSERCSDQSDFDDGSRQFTSLPTWSNQVVTDTEDELFLVIESHNDNDSGVFVTKQQFFHDMDIDQHQHIPDTPKRKFRYSRDFESLKDHAINTFNPQENFARASCKFDMVHKQVRSKMNNMNEIIEQEHSFLRKINKYSLDDCRRRDFLETDFEFVDNVNEYCDNNETMIV